MLHLLTMLLIQWQLIANDSWQRQTTPGICETEWTFINNTPDTIPATGWEIRYCQLSVVPFDELNAALPIVLERVSASSHRITPRQDAFVPMAPGERRTYRVAYKGYILKNNGAPEGAFLVVSTGGKDVITPMAIEATPFARPEQWSRGVASNYTYMDGERMYAYYANLSQEKPTLTADTTQPRFAYRGLMLDIARNFTKKADILRVIDYMAVCRLNRLHLHLSDDEGWRLEIPGLPELTEIGSKRGFTRDETTCLLPYYGGGADAEDETNPANGYLSRQDYIDILLYADSLGIQVIPEIDVPGHSRAAIVAMKHHARFCLSDPSRDTVSYSSAQSYTDNILAINQPATLAFMEKVIQEIAAMYAEAGLPTTYFHLGGDEVAGGVYTGEEQRAFISQVIPILHRYGFTPAGWEEISHTATVSDQPLCYCWKPSQKRASELSESGYPVVLSCANVLYFDHVYVRHPEETGLFWAGAAEYIDTYRFEPIEGRMVQGVQAQVFAETVRNFDMVQRYLFPRLFALEAVAWGKTMSEAEWNDALCDKWLPMMKERFGQTEQGFHFHLSMPGIHREGTQVFMNCLMHSATIRYTIDGSEPDESSPAYVAPVDVPENSVIKARAYYLGEKSAVSVCLPH